MNSDLKVHFYLRHNEVKSDGEIPIMGRITTGKSMAQFRAKCSVQESLWDVSSGRATGKSKAATELNRTLDKINLSIHSYHQELLAKKENITALEVKYKALLSKANIAAEEVKGSHYGSPFCGIIYSATDNDDNKVGNPFSAATLGKFAGSAALERKYKTSKEHIEKIRPGASLKRTINQAFAGATTKEQLQYNLFEKGIGVVYRENAAGRLYGVTFIDHNTGVVLNDSRLGKEYAANAIVDRLENPQKYEHLTNSATSHSPQHSSQPPYPTQEGQHPLSFDSAQQSAHNVEQHSEGGSIGNSIGSLFDISLLPNGDDPEEEQFRRQMQHKKKKGRRM